MSLASFLLGAGKKQPIDKELDGLLKSQVRDEDRPSSTTHVASSENQKKRKSKKHEEERKKKRSKPSDAEVNEETVAHDKKARKASRKVVGVDLETAKAESSKVARDSALAMGGEDGVDPSDLVHETLREGGSSRQKGDGLKKYAPANETSEQRDARTIFIGNVPPEAAQERPLQKRLRQHILTYVPTAKIESMRFRSIPFQIPTTNLSLNQDASDDKKKARQHDRDRAASWREAHPDDDTPKTDEKKFLTPSQKKKIAFINHHIHSGADSIHAYIVFAYPKPPESRPPNLPPPPPVMDPFEAARLALEKCNGTMFMDRMLRVDAVHHSETSPSSNAAAATTSLAIGDPKLTIFVGNLDFASKEDDLRVFFETLIHAERGLPPQDSGSDGTKHGSWVTRVRMIRDKDTQLGKGFAYVQFTDRSCVDEILALEPDRLKFAKRKLRVQRCKTIPSSVTAATSLSSKPSRIHTSSSTAPKGDPSLGQKLAHLSKDERKQVKAADADRRARRLAKKKARMTLDKQGVRRQGQARERVRKSATTRKSDTARPRKTSKGRVRSEKSLSKRNAKK
ncbi:hypothetical protein PISMIDRAFT_674716 [Pisolithus microcarpus 441]|uniref:Nucleolar protein 12 n=1 Tax=Pisolithus microcarpus 441 TaxID=765257 RepID=A0A0C9ZDH1_9AGAM|nr:hypothetical protein PISMIDRAFT_674716 [Pisolithus microcarpus 441]